MVFGHEGLGWLCCSVVLIRRLEEIWILYTLYMWHDYRGSRSGIWDGVRRQRGWVSNSSYLSQLNSWPFWHPPTASYTKPPGMTLLSKDRGCRCREGHRMALLKCYSKCFCHKLVNLFHVFVRHCNPVLMCLACTHDISCLLQTICRRWTYFKSVCLDWQDTVGETGLKLRQAMPGQAPVFQDHAGCFWLGLFPEDSSHHHSAAGIKSVLDTTVNGITPFRLNEN